MRYEYLLNNELFIFDGNTLNLYKDRIVDNCDERKILENKEKILYKCTIIVTEKCNGACMYCYEQNWNYKRNMNKDTAQNIINTIISNYSSVNEICFFGGEPTLNFPIIKQIVEGLEGKIKVKEYRITTNATLLSDEVISFLDKYKFNVVISLDGPEYIHNILRKGVPHNKVIKAINKIKATSIKNNLIINCTYTKAHKEKIDIENLENYFRQLDLKYEINNVITDREELKVEFFDSLTEEERIVDTYEMLYINPSEAKKNMFCKAIIEAIVEHTYKDKFCYELCEEYGLTFMAGGEKIPCNKFNEIRKYDWSTIDEMNSKINCICSNCWARGICSECVANHIIDKDNIPYDEKGCKKIKYYEYALEKIIEIMYYNKEKFQKIVENYYSYR